MIVSFCWNYPFTAVEMCDCVIFVIDRPGVVWTLSNDATTAGPQQGDRGTLDQIQNMWPHWALAWDFMDRINKNMENLPSSNGVPTGLVGGEKENMIISKFQTSSLLPTRPWLVEKYISMYP